MKAIYLILLCVVSGCPFSGGGEPRKIADQPKVKSSKVDYKTGKGIPIRERDDGVLVDTFGNPTPYQRQGNPNSDRITIKEGPDCE